MAYQIRYEKIGTKPEKSPKKWTGLIAAICVLALVTGAVTVKTVGLKWIQEVLLPGDPEVTAAALEGLVEDLKDGESLGRAVTAFCEEIMKNAEESQ